MHRERKLLIIGTHPVQYHAPVYRHLNEHLNVPLHMIYASDFSVTGYYDPDFQTRFAWDSDLFTPADKCTFLSRASAGGAKSVAEISTKGLAKKLREVDPAAVMLTGYSPAFHLQAFGHVAWRPFPILFRAETTVRKRSHGWKQRLRSQLLRNVYRRCSRLLPIGEDSYQHYRELGCPKEKLVFSRYCVSTSAFQCDPQDRALHRSQIRSQFRLTADQRVILFSGKLIAHKRPDLLLQSIRRLPEHQRRHVVVLFLGSGPEQGTISIEAAKDPAIPVVFAGFKNQTELSPFYNASDLLALPSVSETWGLVVNEALHHGIPCVVTDTVGSAKDLVKPGITGEISAGTIEAFAAALSRGLDLAQSDGVAANCRDLVENYTVAKAAEGIRDAFLQSLESKSR